MEAGDLVGQLPAGAAPGAVDVRIADAFAQVFWRAGFQYLARPYIERIEPQRARPGQATALEITGYGLCPEATVRVGAQACRAVQVSPGALTCSLTTQQAEETYPVEVVRPGGRQLEARPGLVVMADEGAPALLAVRPDHGPLIGGGTALLVGNDLAGRGALGRSGARRCG